MDCIFCKIASGEIPSKTIYENDGAIAFLDINPLSEGHTLIIPKEHAVKAHEMSEESWRAVADALNVISNKLVKKLGVTDYNILQNSGRNANQEVMHVHFHIIPKTATTGLEFVWKMTDVDIEKAYEKLKG